MHTDEEVAERFGDDVALVCAEFREIIAWIENGPTDRNEDYLSENDLLPEHGDWQSDFRLVVAGSSLDVDCHSKAFDFLDVLLEWSEPYADLKELYPAHIDDLQAKRAKIEATCALVLASIDRQLQKPRAKS